ncbi:hypothetical protein MRX96_034848 [Rhipicephalus microplus]
MALMLFRKLADNPSKEDVEQLCTLATYKLYRYAFLKEFNDKQILQVLVSAGEKVVIVKMSYRNIILEALPSSKGKNEADEALKKAETKYFQIMKDINGYYAAGVTTPTKEIVRSYTLDKTKVKGDHVFRTVAADNVLAPVLHRVFKTSLYLHKIEVINYKNLKMSLVNLPDVDADQLFFLLCGQTLCEPHEDTARALSEAPWPPTRIRLNTALANYFEFAKAFKCGNSTAMNPKKRCSVFDFE